MDKILSDSEVEFISSEYKRILDYTLKNNAYDEIGKLIDEIPNLLATIEYYKQRIQKEIFMEEEKIISHICRNGWRARPYPSGLCSLCIIPTKVVELTKDEIKEFNCLPDDNRVIESIRIEFDGAWQYLAEEDD